jgi:peptidoglycan/LPS O-acetylase OafA/YrhL
VAVLAVVANHAGKEHLPGGYLGVDVFFVISGFVITASLASRPVQGAGRWLADFYARRVRRLTPALVACVLLTALGASLLIAPVYSEAERVRQVGLGGLVGVGNLVLHAQAANYFGDDIELNPFTHLWSLGVEEQFYLVFPLLVLLSGLAAGHRRGGLRLGLLIGSLCLASWLFFQRVVAIDLSAAYFLMPPRFWEMGAGCLVWLLARRGGGRPLALVPAAWALPLAWLVHALVIAALGLAFFASLSLPTGALLTVVATGALLLTADTPTPLVWLLQRPPLVAIGVLSYSLYLWHWSVLSLARWSVGVSGATLPWLLILSLVLAWLSWKLLEEPLRRRPWSAHAGGTLAQGLALTGFGAGALLLGLGPAHSRLYLGRPPQQLAIQDLYQVPEPLLAPRHRPRPWEPGGANPWLVLIGDSHAGMLQPLLPALVEGSQRRITVLEKKGCPFPPSGTAHLLPGCFRWGERSKRFVLSRLRPGDVVMLSLYGRSHFGGGFDSRDQQIDGDGKLVGWPERKRHLYARSLDSFARKVGERGGTLVLIGPFPRFLQRPAHSKLCEPEWFRRPPGDCAMVQSRPLPEIRRDNEPILTLQKELAARQPRVLLFDPVPYLCDGQECRDIGPAGERWFRDNDHISLRGVDRLREPLRAFLRQHGLLGAGPS